MITHSPSIASIAKAIHKAQGALTGVVRDAKNPHFKSRYATLENVISEVKPALQAAGIAFTQAPGAIIDGALEVTTMLIHAESGEFISSTVHVPLPKRDPQAVGAAITYACRYAMMAATGLPPIDDDGEAAMERKPQEPAQGPLAVALSRIRIANSRDDLKAIKNELAPITHGWPAQDRETLNREFTSAWEKAA